VGQYRNGTQRLYQRMTVQTFYVDNSDSVLLADTSPALALNVGAVSANGLVTFTAFVTDTSGVQRVVATYTDGKGAWRSVDLSPTANPVIWSATLPLTTGIDFVVQSVDGAGNIWINDNRGEYFKVNGGAIVGEVYLPLVVR
jgi:hypothetical protein